MSAGSVPSGVCPVLADGGRAARLATLLAEILPDATARSTVPIVHAMRFAAEVAEQAGWRPAAMGAALLLHESQSIRLSRSLEDGERLLARYAAKTDADGASLNLAVSDGAGVVAELATRLRFGAASLLTGARASARPAARPASALTTMPSKPLTAQIVEAYAELSGDRNPIHLEADLADSLGLPGRVVHGMLLAGLAEQALGADRRVSDMRVRFVAPVHVGERVSVDIVRPDGQARARAIVAVDNGPIACIVDMRLDG